MLEVRPLRVPLQQLQPAVPAEDAEAAAADDRGSASPSAAAAAAALPAGLRGASAVMALSQEGGTLLTQPPAKKRKTTSFDDEEDVISIECPCSEDPRRVEQPGAHTADFGETTLHELQLAENDARSAASAAARSKMRVVQGTTTGMTDIEVHMPVEGEDSDDFSMGLLDPDEGF